MSTRQAGGLRLAHFLSLGLASAAATASITSPTTPMKTKTTPKKLNGTTSRLVFQRTNNMYKGMYRQRIQKAWGHTAHRGWARLLLNRARGLIIHGPAHRGANGAAMPTDEDDQDGHFFFNHPERGGYPAA